MAEIKNISISNRKISQNNQYKEMLKNIDINAARAIEANEVLSYDKLQSEVGALNSKANFALDEIRKMEKLEDSCPTCGQEVDETFKKAHIIKHQEDIQNATSLREQISYDITEIQRNNKDYAQKQKTINDWETLFSKIDQTTSSDLLDEGQLRERLEELQSEVRSQQAEISLIEKRNQEASGYNAKIEVILEQTQNFEAELSLLEDSINEVQTTKANLEILKKAFSTNGLIAYKIENLVKELEEVTGEYLAELSDGRFTLNFAISNDKLNVEITDNGNTVDILALSSGEQARVNTATLLGIRKIMNSLSSSRINVLFLDEVISVLDDMGREKLVEVLLEEDLNTYLVSHGWSHPLLEKIEVCKVNEVSEII